MFYSVFKVYVKKNKNKVGNKIKMLKNLLN